MSEDSSHIVPFVDEDDSEMARTFRIMADARQVQLAVPRSNKFSRKQVINAFQDAFQLIGGVPRLAAWAHEHPSDFYKLYAKLLGNQIHLDVGDDGVIKIIHSIAPGPLDGAPKGEVVDGEFTSEAPQIHDKSS